MSAPNAHDGQHLQAPGRGLRRAKWGSGAVSLVALIGMFVTSLHRAPNPAFSVLVAATVLALAAAMAGGAWRKRHRPPYPR